MQNVLNRSAASPCPLLAKGVASGAVRRVSGRHGVLPQPCNLRTLGHNKKTIRAASQHQEHPVALSRALSSESDESPFLEPFVRSFILGVGAGALLEGGHVALQVLAGSFPGVSQYSPLLVADHVTAFASWIALYMVEAVAIMTVLKRFNWDATAAAKEIRTLHSVTKKMLPINMAKPTCGATKAKSEAELAPVAMAATATATTSSDLEASTSADSAVRTPVPSITRVKGLSGIKPLPRKPAPLPPPPGGHDDDHAALYAKRSKELRDRQGYLKNVWYAAAISSNVKTKPVKVELCGKEMVLFRDKDTGRVRCIDNACPHRGAPLSEGWVEEKEGHSCVVCPYHGWALDGHGTLHDVPAAANKGEWPKRSLVDSYPVEEKGGFVWLFFGSKALPEDERPPIPFIPELEDKNWKPVFEEMEFECNHFGVFENAIDMAHIHYLHSDSFGNQGKPEIYDMAATSNATSVTATFKIHNKPVNQFWALFQVPAVEVTATAFLPSTSVVSFTLANGLSFITFVNTVPISKNRSVNRFALVRNLSWDKSGLFNSKLWDGMARRAMIKILTEDKAMVEQLKYDQLPAEYSVRADLPQVQFRKLRQQWADLVGVVPSEEERPAFTITNRDM